MPIKLSSIKPNPGNPRVIRDEKFKKLVQSITEFPKMMELRPMVVDEAGYVLGGNMRLRALQDLGYKEVPDNWVKTANELTEEEKRRFIIADNVGFGEWDWDALVNEWDTQLLQDWGLDIPEFKGMVEPEEEQDASLQWFLNVRCESEEHAQQLYERFLREGLDVKIVT